MLVTVGRRKVSGGHEMNLLKSIGFFYKTALSSTFYDDCAMAIDIPELDGVCADKSRQEPR